MRHQSEPSCCPETPTDTPNRRPPGLLNGELAQPASNTHYSLLGSEEPVVRANLPGSALTEVTVVAAGHKPAQPLLSCLRKAHRLFSWSQSLGITQGLAGNTADHTRFPGAPIILTAEQRCPWSPPLCNGIMREPVDGAAVARGLPEVVRVKA